MQRDPEKERSERGMNLSRLVGVSGSRGENPDPAEEEDLVRALGEELTSGGQHCNRDAKMMCDPEQNWLTICKKSFISKKNRAACVDHATRVRVPDHACRSRLGESNWAAIRHIPHGERMGSGPV